MAEDVIIHAGVFELGHKWAAIAKRLPGRTDNQVKNRYNCFLQSRITLPLQVEDEDKPSRERSVTPAAIDDAALLLEGL